MIRYLSDRIAVMYLGELVQVGPAAKVFDGAQHPYTAALMSAIPDVHGRHGERIKLTGEVPSAGKVPDGCVFQSCCPHRIAGRCDVEAPPERIMGEGHFIRCHLPERDLMRLGGIERVPQAMAISG